MHSQTLQALKDFDNQHDFERMCADVLNALGYTDVEPMAPGGGADGGRDIRFRDGAIIGTGVVTLEKKISDKFQNDLSKLPNTSNELLKLFCIVLVSPTQKTLFVRDALVKGYILEVFDVERLRSLLDASLTVIRRRYLQIDDPIALEIKDKVRRLIRFPAAVSDPVVPPTILERMLDNTLPRRLFDLLVSYRELDVKEVPNTGAALWSHVEGYHAFRIDLQNAENSLLNAIGAKVSCRFSDAWQIYLKYAIKRFDGLSQTVISSGPYFLNFGITWDDAERVYTALSTDRTTDQLMTGLLKRHEDMLRAMQLLVKDDALDLVTSLA